MSGFHVVAAFETEEKAALIHKQNLDVPLYQIPLEGIDPTAFPNVDLLAAHLYQPSHSRVNPAKLEQHDYYLYKFQEILFASRPRSFFLLINAGSIRNERFRHFLKETVGKEYNLAWKRIDVTQMTGIPVRENAACVVGITKAIEQVYEFPSPNNFPLVPVSEFITQDQSIYRICYLPSIIIGR